MNDKPLILTFDKDGRYFVYDAIANCIIEVNFEQYCYIIELKNVGINTFLSKNDHNTSYKNVKELIEEGYLKNSPIENIENGNIDIVEKLLKSKINQLILNVTYDCNFKCRYCSFASKNNFERNVSKQMMNWEIAKKAIDFTIKHSYETKKIELGFYGGEPLYNFEIIKKSINYCNEILTTTSFNYSMTTNLSLANKNIIDFLVLNNVELLVSLDGPKNIHDSHRMFAANGNGTFETLFNKLSLIRKKYPNYFNNNISFNCVIMPNDNIEEINSFFTNNFPHNLVYYNNVNLSNTIYYYKKLDDGRKKTIGFIKSEKETIDILSKSNPFNKNDYPMGQCIPGFTKLFVDINGFFYPCEKVNNMNNSYNIGNIYDGFNIKTIKSHMNYIAKHSNRCKECWAFKICGFCVLWLDGNQDFSEKKFDFFCKNTKYSLKKFFNNYIERIIKYD